ncbi:hypothetical protein N665_1689s0005 [Sinapis alba]|nr:hypothetical protein N665_1689s0005 [Sinapis alba]
MVIEIPIRSIVAQASHDGIWSLPRGRHQVVLNSFFHHPSLSPPSSFLDTISWLQISSTNPKLKTICHILLQATFYGLWQERNSRLRTGNIKLVYVLIKEIKVLVGLDKQGHCSLAFRRASTTDQDSYIYIWYKAFLFAG